MTDEQQDALRHIVRDIENAARDQEKAIRVPTCSEKEEERARKDHAEACDAYADAWKRFGALMWEVSHD